MLVLSLFPGIGLLDMAFELEGFCVVRGPDVLWGGDVRRFHPPAGKFDGVIGGPPCQMFSSLAHLVRANGHEPKFGNLIPEFERCIVEACPAWFVMENVPTAPEPSIGGYGRKSFLLDNSALAGEGGFGLEQRRVRRFSFGMRVPSGLASFEPPNLLRWIDLATFLLPDAKQHEAPVGHGAPPSVRDKQRGGPVTATHDSLENVSAWPKRRKNAVTATTSMNPGCTGATKKSKARRASVTSSDGVQSVRMNRYRLPEACRLQGLPEDFLTDAPFTAEGKLKAVANGVPLPMGRAIAQAVKEAIVRESARD